MPIHPAKRHLVFVALLYRGLELREEHARQAAKVWYGMGNIKTRLETGHSSREYNELYFQGLRSCPSDVRSAIVTHELSKLFDLEGVAGFYFENNIWKLNLSKQHGALVRPYRDERNRIMGLLIYGHLNDKNPRLLTSRTFPRGTAALPYEPRGDRS